MKDSSTSDLSILVLIVLCNTTNIIKNPYLVAKFVEVLFTSCPLIQPQASHFNDLIVNYPFAENFLISALMKFYSG